MEFWNKWKLTALEKKAIISIKKAIKILFKEIPSDKIYAIYIKGSFVRRELIPKSDVDIVPITYTSKDAKKITKLQELKGNTFAPAELLPHSLEEFETGKKISGMTRPDVLLRELHTYKKIYGKNIDVSLYAMRSDEEFFKDFLNAFHKKFIPMYKQKKMSFWNLSKQMIHLAEKEERFLGREPPCTWKSFARRKAIVRKMYEYRTHRKNEQELYQDVLKYLKKYNFI